MKGKQMLRIAAALLLALCLIGTLAACGQTAPAATQAPEATEKPAAATPEATEEPAAETPEATETPAEGDAVAVVFETTDRDGNTWDQSVFAEAKLTMINFWEPWCPPCIGEMPDLERLYQDFREQGFAVIGVYATPGVEDDVDAVLTRTGVSYPILHYCAAFDAFQTGYVPTTVFVDGSGHVVGEITIGMNDYEGWAAIIRELL